MFQSFVVKCPDEKATENLAKKIAKEAKPCDIFLLKGTLGMGKSVFARSFIQSLTDALEVPSPTFTLVQTYEASVFNIYHFDLYRLKSPEEIWELNIEEAFATAVSLIEWPEKMDPYIPKTAVKINITADENGVRLFEFCFPDAVMAHRFLEATFDKPSIHATTVDIDGSGVLIIGDSGKGKSDLALRLIYNKGAVLVADDQTFLVNQNGKLIASVPKTIEGLIEVRGVGIISMPFIPETEVKLVAASTIKDDIERYPDVASFNLEGISVPSILLDFLEPSAPDKIVLKLKTLLEEERQKP